MNIRDELIKKYSAISKHSHYQSLPNSLKTVIGKRDLKVRQRYDEERLNYILDKLTVKNKKILDIGGNTGFFTFELIDKGAVKIDFYEGNKDHAEFVEIAVEALKLQDKIKVYDKYYTFQMQKKKRYDIVLLLNVLHHLGDDYGDQKQSIIEAKKNMAYQLNTLHSCTDYLVFQMGFNWKGDINKPLFKKGAKNEIIDFVTKSTKHRWEMINIGIASSKSGLISYEEINKRNSVRIDSLGEFLNRPLFILMAK